MNKVELFNDHFQNFKVYGIPKAQLIIADPPYNLGVNAYASNPSWYVDGDNKKGESAKAGKEFFDTDKDFRPAEFMHFCSQYLKRGCKVFLRGRLVPKAYTDNQNQPQCALNMYANEINLCGGKQESTRHDATTASVAPNPDDDLPF